MHCSTFTPPSNHFPIKKNVWQTFKSSLDDVTPSLVDTCPLTQYDNIVQAIYDSISTSVPNYSNSSPRAKIKSRPAIWWNKDRDAANNDRKQAWAAFRRTSNIVNLIRTKRLEAIAKKTFKKAKKDSWATFTDSIDFRSSTLVWSKIKRFRNRNLPDSSSLPNNANSIINMTNLIPSICPSSCCFPNFPTSFLDNPQLDTPFSSQELQAALYRSKRNSAPGRDKIDFTIICNTPNPFTILF